MFVYPESGDLVLAGPAGDWMVDDGRIVSKDTHASQSCDSMICSCCSAAVRTPPNSHFGCSINPRQESLAKTQAFLASSSQKPLEPGQRKQWLSDLRDTVGRQDIEIFGIDPASRVAGVLVEADYHMKLIGMGLADGVDGVESYLESIHLRPGEPPPAMSVLRWWFTLKYDAIARSEANDAFELVGQGVRVLSENEMLAEQGQRVHTGQSDPLNRQFAESFTAHFAELAEEISGVRRAAEHLRSGDGRRDDPKRRAGRQGRLEARRCWLSGEKLRLPQSNVPREVETVINHRVVNQRTILAGVSGGVMVAPSDVLKTAAGKRKRRHGHRERAAPAPKDLAAEAWWWDATWDSGSRCAASASTQTAGDVERFAGDPPRIV